MLAGLAGYALMGNPPRRKKRRRNPEGPILYENGDFWVTAATFGKKASKGYEVNQHVGTHSVRVASIGFAGREGLTRAIKEADRRATTKPRSNPQDYWWYSQTRNERHHRWSSIGGHGAILSPTKPHSDKAGVRWRRDKRTEKKIGLPDTNRQNPGVCRICLQPANARYKRKVGDKITEGCISAIHAPHVAKWDTQYWSPAAKAWRKEMKAKKKARGYGDT